MTVVNIRHIRLYHFIDKQMDWLWWTMILQSQFLSYFQAKASKVGLRLLNRANVLPHFSMRGINDILNKIEFNLNSCGANRVQSDPLGR